MVDAIEIESLKLDFEREKWRDEVRLREKQIDIERRDQRDRHGEVRLRMRAEERSRWTNPIVLAVFAAAVAAAGNAGVAWLNGYEANRATVTKGEADRILEAIKTSNPDNAATNLGFLLDAGLIENAETKTPIENYLKHRKKGEGVALPAAIASAPTTQQTAAITDTPNLQDNGKKASSTDNLTNVQVSFLNLSHDPVQLFWIDYAGQPQLYGAINAGGSSTIGSYAGHLWVAKSQQGVELLRYVVSTPAPLQPPR